MMARPFAARPTARHDGYSRPVRSTGRHERVLGRKGEHEGEGGPFVAPAQRASFPLVNTSSRVHVLPCQKPPSPRGQRLFQQRRATFSQKKLLPEVAVLDRETVGALHQPVDQGVDLLIGQSAHFAGQPSGDRRGPRGDRGDRRGPRGDRGERRGGAPKRNNKQ